MATREICQNLDIDSRSGLVSPGNTVRPARTLVIKRPQARRSPGPWAALARDALVPVCDGLALAVAALLMAPRWATTGYAVAALLILHIGGCHRPRICLRVSDEIPRLAGSVALAAPLLLPWTESADGVARLGVASVALLMAMRASSYAVLRAGRRAGWLTERALIVGPGELGIEVAELLLAHRDLGLSPVGFIDSEPPDRELPLPLLGNLSELSDVVSRYGARRVIVSFPAGMDADLVSVLRANRSLPAEVYVIPRMYEMAAAIPRRCMDEVWGIPLVRLRPCGPRWAALVAKRAFDLIVGSTLLIVLAPVLLALMAALLLCRGRPVLFRQARVTCSGRVTKITKLRTITDENPETQWTVPPDRCSRLGRWLRATHLDELPQLVNVIRGDMSLIGPRPERPYFTSQFAKKIPRYEDRHRIRSGMTGWAQVHGLTGDTSITERVRFDNHYIEHWSFWLDVVILARTLAEPLSGIRNARRPPPR